MKNLILFTFMVIACAGLGVVMYHAIHMHGAFLGCSECVGAMASSFASIVAFVMISEHKNYKSYKN